MENTHQITVADLDTIKNIIDLACTRGAFRGAEVSQVGAVFDKLSAFLDAVIAKAKADEEAAANASETSETSDADDSKTQGEE